MNANLDNIHEIYNIFRQKNRMNADIINLFDRFHLSQTLRHLKETVGRFVLAADSAAAPLPYVP